MPLTEQEIIGKLAQYGPLVRARLMSKVRVDEATGCWQWTASCRRGGYGQLGLKGGVFTAHRLSYIVHIGEIPGGMFVCHRCDNRKCLNPAHLFVGTAAENTADMMTKGRFVLGRRYRGEEIRSAKLSEAEVIAIRNKHIPRQYTRKQLASEYGVSVATIKNVLCGRCWSHVGGAT